MTRLQVAVVVMGFVALNVIAALGYKLSRPRLPPEPEVAVQPPAPAQLDVDAEKFRGYRSAGLAALEKGDYDKAVEQFMLALRVGRADSDIMELIKMAKEFQARAPARVAVAAPEPEPEPEPEPREKPPSLVKKREPPRRAAPKREPVKVAEARPRVEEPPLPLTLLVTSIPSGLVIEVDGSRKDMTPAKVQVPSGTHSVSFFKGETRLLQRSVSGEGGQVLTVDADLSDKLAPPAAAVDQPAAVARLDPPATAPLPTPARAPAPAPVSSAAVAPPAVVAPAPKTGELQIISLNVHGEVFVDGRSYGFTPVVAKNLPAQQVKVEVKVDGSVRRSRNVDVVAGRRSTIKIP